MRMGLYRGKYRQPSHKRGETNIFLISSLIIAILFFLLALFASNVRPLLIAYSESKANYVATQVINEAISERFSKTDISYTDLVTLDKNTNGEIVAFQANTFEMNKLRATISNDVQSKLSALGMSEVSIPMGSISKNDFFAGMGPRIPIKVSQSGYTKVDFISEFSEAGINQTKNRIILEVTAKIGIYIPTAIRSATVTTQIPVAETIIVGNVPNTYLNMTGTDTDPSKYINLIPKQDSGKKE